MQKLIGNLSMMTQKLRVVSQAVQDQANSIASGNVPTNMIDTTEESK